MWFHIYKHIFVYTSSFQCSVQVLQCDSTYINICICICFSQYSILICSMIPHMHMDERASCLLQIRYVYAWSVCVVPNFWITYVYPCIWISMHATLFQILYIHDQYVLVSCFQITCVYDRRLTLHCSRFHRYIYIWPIHDYALFQALFGYSIALLLILYIYIYGQMLLRLIMQYGQGISMYIHLGHFPCILIFLWPLSSCFVITTVSNHWQSRDQSMSSCMY